MSIESDPPEVVAIVGGGPAGLMAAEVLSGAGVSVDLYDAMPSVGRKFLLAGKGGLNLTHAEPFEELLARYSTSAEQLRPMLHVFGPEALRAWTSTLGISTFVGSSGRVFPGGMKAAPLLRAWLHRLRQNGVRFHMRHRWKGWDSNNNLLFTTPQTDKSVHADAVILALGGGSWPQLGSDGSWVTLLGERGIKVKELRPANCGFDVCWSGHFISRNAGQPVKNVTASFTTSSGDKLVRHGEFLITSYGAEGELIYSLSAPLRDEIAARGKAIMYLDLVPGRSNQQLEMSLSRPRAKDSLANQLRKRAGIVGVKAHLLRETVDRETLNDPVRLAAAIKSLPLTLVCTRPLAEAISTAGGVKFAELDKHLMIKKMPGVFCAGEMLDWEAPTGGYLLTACFATGHAAGRGALEWLKTRLTKN